MAGQSTGTDARRCGDAGKHRFHCVARPVLPHCLETEAEFIADSSDAFCKKSVAIEMSQSPCICRNGLNLNGSFALHPLIAGKQSGGCESGIIQSCPHSRGAASPFWFRLVRLRLERATQRGVPGRERMSISVYPGPHSSNLAQ